MQDSSPSGGSGRQTSITGRWPGSTGRSFVPIPDELFEYREELGLDVAMLALVVDLERRRWKEEAGAPVRVTYAMLSRTVGLKESALREAVKRLAAADLLKVTRTKSGPKKHQPNLYDLRPLWRKLAEIVATVTPSDSTPVDFTPVKSEGTEEPLTPVVPDLHHTTRGYVSDKDAMRVIDALFDGPVRLGSIEGVNDFPAVVHELQRRGIAVELVDDAIVAVDAEPAPPPAADELARKRAVRELIDLQLQIKAQAQPA